MKTIWTILAGSLTIANVLAQGGSLTPPSGAIGKEYKTLDEIEPRTPIVDGASGVAAVGDGFKITSPGSYYLVDDIEVSSSSGINISASNVTVDLNGFTIRSTASSAAGSGVVVPTTSYSNIYIKNGTIAGATTYDSTASGDKFSGGGFSNGVYSLGALVSVKGVIVSGVDAYGIYCAGGTNRVEDCSVNISGNIGILATIVKSCSASTCGEEAIKARVVVACHANSVGNSAIARSGSSSSGVTVANSYAKSTGESSGDHGIDATNGVIFNCHGESQTDDGLHGEVVVNSYGKSNGSASGSDGINATIAIGCVTSGGETISNKYNMP